jgi:hypothetical protein
MKSHRESNCHLSRDGALDALHGRQRHVYAGIRGLLILMENPENSDSYKSNANIISTSTSPWWSQTWGSEVSYANTQNRDIVLGSSFFFMQHNRTRAPLLMRQRDERWKYGEVFRW